MSIGLNKNLLGLLLLGFALLSHTSMAQDGPNLGNTSRQMNAAIAAMEKGAYQQANSHFREIIESNVPIPPEMPYHFAVTLFQLNQFDNSANFVQKYLDLNGFKGDHYQEAKELEKALEKPLNEIQACNFCDNRGYRLVTCSTCDGDKVTEQACGLCRGYGIIGCSRCAGDGLVTKKNVFNIVEYFECERCSGEGRLTCTKCNGSLKEFSECRTCLGKGHLGSEIICDHKENENFSVRTGFLNPFAFKHP